MTRDLSHGTMNAAMRRPSGRPHQGGTPLARHRQAFIDDLLRIARRLPWRIGVALAIACYFRLRKIAAGEVSATARPGQMGWFVAQSLVISFASVGQYVLPPVLLAGAGLSAHGRRRCRALHAQVVSSPDTSTLNSLRRREFEWLIGGVLRREGYTIRETEAA